MNSDLLPLLDACAGLRVLVIGEAMLDSYLEGQTGRFCREAPVPVVSVSDRQDMPGGAANTAANVRSLGGAVEFLSVVGDDEEATRLTRSLEGCHVAPDGLLRLPGRRTLAKNRLVADSQILMRFDQGTTTDLDRESERRLGTRLAAALSRSDAVVVSDYGYGILTPRLIRMLADGPGRPRVVVVDSKHRLPVFRDVRPTAIKPNFDEATELLGKRSLSAAPARANAIRPHGPRLLELTGARLAAVTLDSEGALLFEQDRAPYHACARPARQSCVAGAGDTFTAALGLALAAGASGPAAVELASAAAAVVVGKQRTACCSAGELREYLSSEGKYFRDAHRLAARLDFYRQQGKRIVFTNGCFDILHSGHVAYLHRAKSLGDVLVIGVNTDESIRRLKGPTRPINRLDDRMQVLAALGCVDHLVAFGEDTPCEIIRLLRPNVFVKGGDYTRERLPEAPLVEELGGVVQILPFVQDRSTSHIIERIQETHRPPVACAAGLATGAL
jgi:D-beta-D-heptose 7-phosphate kinase/D-beta-D-heptose 1-phosphate adenosyltransferase